MDSSVLDWIKLNISVTSGVKVCSLVSHFGSASAVYRAGREALLQSGCLDEKTVDDILSADEKRAEAIHKTCLEHNWHILAPGTEYYPKEFAELKDFPLLLYCAGDISLLKKYPKIAVVGTRNPSDVGLTATYLLACCLSATDVVTVSGGALGIDTSVHEGSLTGAGGTVSILGCGLGARYLPENSFMRSRIIKNGLIMTEHPPFQMPSTYSFPRRNRLIAALGQATVVAQSGARGGSFITADYTKKYNKPLFCFDETVVSSPGCSRLLAQGAFAFSTPGEILGRICPDTDFGGEKNRAYSEYDLHNGGIKAPHIIKPSTLTPDLFALYNGITPCEASQVMGGRLKPRKNTNSASPEKKPMPSPRKAKDESAVWETKKTAREKPEAESEKAASRKAPEQKKPPEQNRDLSFLSFVSENAKAVYEKLSSAPMLMDEIQYATALPAGLVAAAVTELELCDAVTLHLGNRVSKR